MGGGYVEVIWEGKMGVGKGDDGLAKKGVEV